MFVSILGDSISTFAGWQPKEYRVFYDAHQQQRNGLSSVQDMWWAQVIHALKGQLCANSSFSGSRVSGQGFPAGFSLQRIHALAVKNNPDLILVYLGLNDFGYGVPLERPSGAEHMQRSLFFADAYDLMLRQIRLQYPHARVCCASLLETYVRDHPEWVFSSGFSSAASLSAYNGMIERACKQNGVFFADLRQFADAYETLDGAHPTIQGHALLADCWKRALHFGMNV